MAEFVEEQLEQQLPELEAISTAELLDDDEVMQMLKHRRRLEYKLQKRQKQLRDLQAYIQHEVGLLLLLRHRRHTKKYFFKKERIEAPIIDRIIRLHRFACHRFQHELPCWLAQIHFCERIGRLQVASKVWSRLMQVFPYREDLWVAASDWHWTDKIERIAARSLRRKHRRGGARHREALGVSQGDADAALAETPKMLAAAGEVLSNAELARAFLLRGLRVNSNSQMLLLALLKLEAQLSLWLHQLLHLLHRELPAAAAIDQQSVLAAQPALLVLHSLLDTAQPSAALLRELHGIVQQYQPLADAAAPLLEPHMHLLLQQPAGEDEKQQDKKTEIKEKDLVQLHNSAGLQAVRARWQQLVRDGACSVQLLQQYVDIECKQQPVQPQAVRHQLQRLAGHFGRDSVEYWLIFVNFEQQFGDPANVGDIHWRARKFLQPSLLQLYHLRCLYPQLSADMPA